MTLLDSLITLLVRWLCPPAPWLFRRQAQAWWLDGAANGAVLGGVLAYALLILVRLLRHLAMRLLSWLIRKRNTR